MDLLLFVLLDEATTFTLLFFLLLCFTSLPLFICSGIIRGEQADGAAGRDLVYEASGERAGGKCLHVHIISSTLQIREKYPRRRRGLVVALRSVPKRR